MSLRVELAVNINPYIIGARNAVTGMGDNQAVKKLVVPLKCYVKAAPNQGTDYGLHLGISPGNRLTHIAFDSKRNQAGGGNNLQGNKSTEVAYYLLTLLFQFSGSTTIILIVLLNGSQSLTSNPRLCPNLSPFSAVRL